MRFPVEIIRRIRERMGDDFVIMYRLSMLDLVADGGSWDEVIQLARAIEEAGASIINTGIGWHEARVPTIATLVPRGGFTFVTKRLIGSVSIPLLTTNRLNMPGVCEEALEQGCADLISMARPFLADATWSSKPRPTEPMKSTRASAAIRPALIKFSNSKSHRAWSIHGPHTKASGRWTRVHQIPVGCCCRRRTRRVECSNRIGQNRSCRHPLRKEPSNRRAIQHGQANSRQGGVQ